MMTYLTENLASKGYVVVAIDHTDSTYTDAGPFASTLLNRMIAREHKVPSVRDMSGVLTKGEFRTEGSRLIAKWPMERVFFESLSGASQ